MLVRNDQQLCPYPVAPEPTDRTSDSVRSLAASSAIATPGQADLLLRTSHAFVMSLSLGAPGSVRAVPSTNVWVSEVGLAPHPVAEGSADADADVCAEEGLGFFRQRLHGHSQPLCCDCGR